MSIFLGYARGLFAKTPGVAARLKSAHNPLYYRRPSRFIMLTPIALGLDVLFTANTVSLTWRNWKEQPDASGATPPLRPWPIRLAVCSMEFLTGALVASTLLILRARTVTLLSIIPPKQPRSQVRHIFMRTAGNFGMNGTIYPVSECVLTRVEEKVTLLQVKGMFGSWQMDLEKAVIEGAPVESYEEACKTIATRWHGAGGKGEILTA